MKTRSTSGVGQKVDLKFDISGLRISDLDDDEDQEPMNQTSAMFDKLKQRSQVNTQEKSLAENSVVENTIAGHDKLRSLLKKSS